MANNLDLTVIIDAVDNASKVIAGVGGAADNLGKNMAIVGAGSVAAFSLATKAAIDFETGFAGVRKAVSGSDEELATLSSNLRDIAKIAPVSAVELTGIAEMAGQLGVTGVENITKFTETITKFTTATGIAGEEAATNFAQIANVMGEPIANIDRMGSVVAQLGDSGAATERDILAFAQRIAGAGKIAGLATKDIFAIGSAMASVGVEAEAGGTAVQKVLLDINTSVLQGGDQLEIFAKTAGMSAKEFAEGWAESPQEVFTEFVEGLGKQGDEAINTLSELGLEDQRLIRAFLSLANAGDLLNSQFDVSNNEWRNNTRLTEEAEKRYATTASQIEIFKNNLNDVGITIGSVILPALNQVFTAIAPLVAKFAEYAEQNPKTVATIVAIGAAIGALGAALIVLTPVVGAVIGVFTTLWTVLTVGATTVGAVVAILGGPLTIAIIAITALIAAFALAWNNNWFGIRDTLQAAWVNIKAILDKFAPLFNVVFTAVAQSIIGPLVPAVKWVMDNFQAVMNVVNKVKDAANSAIQSAQQALSFGTGKRAMGGPVSTSSPVLVGEKGPELFVPPTAGTIVPNNQMGGAGKGNNIYININAEMKGDMDIDKLVERLQFAISKQGLL